MGKAVKSIFAAIIVLLALAGILYRILPKESWINLRANPVSAVLTDFDGMYTLGVEKISFFSGSMVNQDSAELSINGREPERYEKGELEILFERKKKSDSITRPNSHLMFSLEINDSIAIVSGRSKDDLLLSRPYGSFHSINFGERSITTSGEYIYELTTWMSDVPLELTFFEGGRIDVDYGRYNVYQDPEFKSVMKIYIQGEEVDIQTLEFYDQVSFDLDLDSNYIDFYFDTRNETCIVNGTVSAFEGTLDYNDAILKQTYLNTQSSYDIGLHPVNVSADDTFPIKYMNTDEEENVLYLSGLANNVTVGSTSFHFNYITFLYNNLSAIVLAIFGAFVSTYIPMVITPNKKMAKKKKSEANHQNADHQDEQ